MRLLSDPEQGLLVVPVSEEQKAAAVQQGESKSLQFMMSFSMGDYEAMKRLVEPGSCIMPDRHAQQHAAGGRSRAAAAPAAEPERQGKRSRHG